MERAILTSLVFEPSARLEDARDSLDELAHLARSAGASVVASIMQRRERPDPASFFGRGKVEELAAEVERLGADLLIVDQELSPRQEGTLGDSLGTRVIDRTRLILDIFAQRARTREGRLQVELAQLTYLLPRLAGGYGNLSRLGGGIGTRGPGEKKLEHDRRLIRKRIARLKEEVEQVRRHRRLHSHARQRVGLPMATLVGYTNAGKSTLLEALSGSPAHAENRLFSTLDSATRRIRLPGGETMLLSDTVGFIRHLPHQLVAAFNATLEVIIDADILIHVIDVSRDDSERQAEVVRGVLGQLGAGGHPVLEVFNKCDLVMPPLDPTPFRPGHPDACLISARQKTGLPRLLEQLQGMLATLPERERRPE
jgi:GTP-binding protein HflX